MIETEDGMGCAGYAPDPVENELDKLLQDNRRLRDSLAGTIAMLDSYAVEQVKFCGQEPTPTIQRILKNARTALSSSGEE